MKIKRIKILNSPFYNPEAILDYQSFEVQDHLAMMCQVMKVWPEIIIIEIE